MTQSRSTLTAPLSVAATGVVVAVATAPFVTPYMTIATVNLFVLHTGFTLRKTHRHAHAALMLAGIVSDLALVLTLQIQRSAVQTALAFKLSAWNQAHIYCSTTATALYLPMFALGTQLLRASPAQDSPTRSWHRRLGYATLLFRTLGFFLMFSMLKKE